MLRVIDSQWNKLQDEAYVIYPMGEEAVIEYVYDIKDTDILLVNGDGYSVYATGFGVDSREYVIDFYMENNTDSLLSVRTSPNAINHMMFDNYIFADVTAGRKAFMQMRIDDDNLNMVGLESFDDIVKISTLLNCDLGGQNVFEEVVAMYPNGQETAEMKQPQLNGELLFENDVFAIYHTSSGSEKKNFCLGICVVNKTDSLIRVDFQNLVLNGAEYGNLFSSVNIMGQSRCNTVLKWNMDTMKNLGVDRMETFKIDMVISDEQTYNTLYEGSVEGKEFEK